MLFNDLQGLSRSKTRESSVGGRCAARFGGVLWNCTDLFPTELKPKPNAALERPETCPGLRPAPPRLRLNPAELGERHPKHSRGQTLTRETLYLCEREARARADVGSERSLVINDAVVRLSGSVTFKQDSGQGFSWLSFGQHRQHAVTAAQLVKQVDLPNDLFGARR